MSNKKYYLFIILFFSINIDNILSFKYPKNKDLLSSEKDKSTSIEVSTKNDYDKYILNNKYVISIFHADWCGHCKRFLPVFNEASKYSIISKTWKLLKIPCSKYPPLCDAFSIEGYPTIKIYKDSQEMKGISPPRDIENFLEFLIKISTDPIIRMDNKPEFYNNYGTFSPVVEYNKNNEEFISCIKKLAYMNEFSSEYYFGIIPMEENKIIFDFDNESVVFNYDNNNKKNKNICDDIKIFLRNNKYPLVSEASFNLMRKINRDKKEIICILFYNSNNDIINNFIKNEYKNISKENREIIFTYFSVNQKNDLSNYFNIKFNKETEFQIFIYNFYKERFYKDQIYDTNINNIDTIKNNVINLIKRINKLNYASNNKFNDFIYNHKILLIVIFIALIIGIIYMLCFLDIDDEEDIKEKEDKDKIRKEKKKLINNDFIEKKEKNEVNKINEEKKDNENKEEKNKNEEKDKTEEKDKINKEKLD